ncbi:hypothetical protein ACPF8X_32105, partial [Streptomyces sp. G35A]
MTVPGPPGVPASPLCGALAELLASAGADDAGPLAVSLVAGGGGSLEAGGSEDAGGSDVGGSEDAGGSEVGGVVEEDGFDVGGFDAGLDGDVVGSPGSVVPLGSSDGSPEAEAVGVGSSDVPRVPSGPGSVGRLVASPVSPPSSAAGSAPRLPSSTPWLADGLTPTLSDGLPASLSDVAPR